MERLYMGATDTRECRLETSGSFAPGVDPAPRPQDALLSNMDLPFKALYFPLGYAIEIVTNDLEVLEAAREGFGHLGSLRSNTPLRISFGISESSAIACPPEPTHRQFRHLYSFVADPDNQALLDFKTCTASAWLTKSAVSHRRYLRRHFLEKIVYLLVGATFVTELRAACVSKGGKGILLFGESGAGKSTLSYACARSGWTYTSDDTSYLINDADFPRVIGHAHRIRFRPSAVELFPELGNLGITPSVDGDAAIEVPISGLPVQQAAIEADVHAIVYLKRNDGAPAGLVKQPSGTATLWARAELNSAGEIRARQEKILEKLREVPACELHFSDLETALRLLDQLASSI
jgi:hypothetical protein